MGATSGPVLPPALQHSEKIAALAREYAKRHKALLKERSDLVALATQDAVHCPCCGGIFSHFDPFRHKPEHPWRENARCPVCGSLERHRRLWLQLCGEEGLFRGGSLLHFAPELFLKRVFEACGGLEYVDCDLQEQRAGQRVDITKLPFASASFDWCICSHVLEHVDDDRAGLAELARVLKKGAVAWLMVPTLKQGTLVHDPPPEGFTANDHRREYGLEDFVARCEEAGLAVEVLHAKALDPALRARHRLSNHIYRCRKP